MMTFMMLLGLELGCMLVTVTISRVTVVVEHQILDLAGAIMLEQSVDLEVDTRSRDGIQYKVDLDLELPGFLI